MPAQFMLCASSCLRQFMLAPVHACAVHAGALCFIMDRVVRFSCVAAYAVVSATALAQAVGAAATVAFHPLPSSLDADSLALAVFVGATADSANDALIPIFRFKSPRVKIERAARPASGRGGPRYPREHVGSGYEGRVVLEF